MLHEDGKASVKIGDRESEWFGMLRSMRQGYTVLPWLLKLAREKGDCGARDGDQDVERVEEMKYLGGDENC